MELEVSRVSQQFGDTEVLRDISFTVATGEFLSLVGPSGCGKSTLLRIIAGLTQPCAGGVIIGGIDVTGIRAAERDVALVFQSYALYPHMTVRENMALPLVMRRLTASQRLPIIGRAVPGSMSARGAVQSEVQTTARMLGLEGLLDRKPAQLSGGQKQRVALGRAIIRAPRLFLIDEPLSNLDAQLRVQTRTEIAALVRRLGVTTIYVTHDQTEAMSMSDRIAVMIGGAILQVATPERLFTRLDHIAVAQFVGSPQINLIAGDVRGDRLFAGGVKLGRISGAPPGPVTIGLRPDGIRFSAARAAAAWPGRVLRSEYLGSDCYVHVEIDNPAMTLVVRLPDPLERHAPGALVHLSARPEDILVFDTGTRWRHDAEISDAA